MIILSANDLSLSFGSTEIFSNISFEVDEGEMIGMIGVNGAGKTSLFKIITGELQGDGNISKSKQLKLGYVEQHVSSLGENIAYEEVLSVFSKLMKIEDELEIINDKLKKDDLDEETMATLIDKQANLQEYYQNNNGMTYRSLAKSTLMGLGFSEIMMQRNMAQLSGGEKSKVLLAKMLLSDTNLLLLDEPTNHLDIASVEWLEGFLKNYKGSAIIISHDRYFLDKVTNRILEMHNNKMSTYTGNYSTYMQKKSSSDEVIQKHYKNDTKEIKRLEGVVEEQRRWGREKNIRKAENFEKKIIKLKEALVVPNKPPSHISFEFKAEAPSGDDVLIAKGLAKTFDNKTLFADVDIHIRAGERVFLLGSNGSGKTTLLKSLVGQLKLDAGSIELGAGVKIGYYDQNISNLKNNQTILDYIYDCHPSFTQTELRNALASFLFKGSDVFKQIDMLSGGEKARVSLLNLMLSGSNLLIMDEPTNHLDMASSEMLEDALFGYNGTQLIVSHDRYFVNKLADRILYVDNGKIEEFLGNYDEFSEAMNAKNEIKSSQSAIKKTIPNDYLAEKERKKEIRTIKSAKKKAEKSVSDFEAKIEELHDELCKKDVLNNSSLYQKVSQELEETNEELETSFDEWTRLSEELFLLESSESE